MKAAATQRALAPLLIVLGAGAFGWLLHFAGTWLVHHDSVYYRLSDAGFRPLTNLAEELFAVGPIPPIVVGLLLGAGLIAILRWYRTAHHP